MTYDEYISETEKNCRTVLSECTAKELGEIEHLKRTLWEDDRVTGVYNGYCTSVSGTPSELIKGVLFDKQFLADFNEHDLNMQTVMAYGPEAVDVVIRCLSLKHINVVELAEREKIRRQKEARSNSAVRV